MTKTKTALMGLFDLIQVLNTTHLTKYQKDLIRAEYLLDMGFDYHEDTPILLDGND